jgi:hypothetical protein
MVLQPNSQKKTMGRLTIMAAVMIVCLVFSASALSAATYTVTGQVFRVHSQELAEKTDADGTIDFTTMETGKFPFVHIKIYMLGTSVLLAEGDAGTNGQFNIAFDLATGPPGPDVECRVYEVIDGGSTQQPAVDDTYNTISAIGMWTTDKKLLVVNDDIIDYLEADPPDPGVGLVFTRIGDVPVAYIPQTAPTDEEEKDKQGMADVPGDAPAYVPNFVDCPFGGRLEIYGSFGPTKEDVAACSGIQVDWYQVTIQKIAPTLDSPLIFKDALSKVKTIVNTSFPLTITNETEKLGPYTGSDGIVVVEGLYRVNRDSTLTYYSHPDLRAYWNTAGQEGLFEITVKYYQEVGGTPTAPVVQEITVGSNPGDCFDTAAPGNTIGELFVLVNNRNMDVSFDNIFIKVNEADADGYDYNAEGICSIMDLKDASNEYGIQIKFTAHHPGGYMRSYTLSAIANDTMAAGGPPDVVFVQQSYDPTASTAPEWEGTPATGASAFKDHSHWDKTCAFIFDLVARDRIQNGYYYIHWPHKRRAYYIIHD